MDSLPITAVDTTNGVTAEAFTPAATPTPPQVATPFAVPAGDVVEFAQLPEDCRDDVQTKLRLMRAIHTAPSIRQGCIQQACAVGAKGFSAPRLRALYDAYVAKWDWRTLINKAKAGPRWYATDEPRATLPRETIEHWRGLCERNQRKCAPAYRQLQAQVARWSRGDASSAIPGYPSCPALERETRMPRGMTYSNLMRLAPSRFELAVTRQGRSAGANHRPLVYTTRAHLWVGSHYMFDDMWHDHFVNILDTRQTGRPLEFHALDLFSACKFAWGARVRTENASTGKMEGLKEENMRCLVAQVMAMHGYSERGTVLVVEHGTAAIREALEELLHDLTAGKVTVSRSGMEGDPALIGQYAGRSKGNFRFKAALESLGNLIHNELATLAGQTGLNVDRRPEWLHGLLKHNDALMSALAALAVENPDRAQLLRFPLIEFRQFLDILLDVYRRINGRQHHALEGWGNNVTYDPAVGTMRRMSPIEVWDVGRPKLTRMPPHQVAMVLGSDLGVERVVRRAMIEIMDKSLSPDLIRYDASTLREGQKYLTVVNPFAADRIFCFDARGGFVAACPQIAVADRGDLEALKRAFGFAAKREAELLAPVRERGMEITRQRIADARHNAAVLAGEPVTAMERAVSNERSHTQRTHGREAAEDILGPVMETDRPDVIVGDSGGESFLESIL